MDLSSRFIEIIDFSCPYCGCETSNKKIMGDHTEFGECTNCGKMTYHKPLRKVPLKEITDMNKVKCPYCHSTNTKKISTTSKVAHGITFGIFAANKIVNQWHCNNCKSDF